MTTNLKISILPIGTDLSKVTYDKQTGYFNGQPIQVAGQMVHVRISRKEGCMFLVPANMPVNNPKVPRKAHK